MAFFENWVPNDNRAQNSSSLQVWINANDTNGYALSGSVVIADDDYGTNPIIETINNLGTLGGSLTRNTLADDRSPQLMTGSFSNLNGFKFGLLRGASFTDTRMESTIYPPHGDEPRQVFMVASQIFHGDPGDPRGNTYKVAFAYGNKSTNNLFAFYVDGIGTPSFDDKLTAAYFGGGSANQTADDEDTFSAADPFGMFLAGYTNEGDGAGANRLFGNGEELNNTALTLSTKTRTDSPAGDGLYLGSNVEAGSADVDASDMIIHELLIYGTGVEGSDDSEGFKRIVEGYLAHKWGFASSLAASHPFRNEAPVFGYRQQPPTGDEYSPEFVDNRMSQLVSQYDRGYNQEHYVPFRVSVRGPSNLRLRPRGKVYKVTKS
jgi:hypothetical protein